MALSSLLRAFRQQELPACQPFCSTFAVALSSICVGVLCVVLGLVFSSTTNETHSASFQYAGAGADLPCLETECTLSFELKQELKSPVFLYYELDNFYQNHRRYLKSRSDKQLAGNFKYSYDDLKECSPLISVGDSHNAKDLYYPCGLVAKSFFNDTFTILKNNKQLAFNKENIAWKSEKQHLFKPIKDEFPGVHVVDDVSDEDFIVWMRAAALPRFRKLYRVYNEEEALKGLITVKIENNFNVDSFGGKKFVVFATSSPLGAKNKAFTFTYIITGIFLFSTGFILVCFHFIYPRISQTKYKQFKD